MIHTDTFLTIGSSHQVCEDYIISDQNPFPYVILADGCSSSKNTDMGARILCLLAKQYLLYRKDESRFPILDYEQMGSWIIHNAEMTARQLGLNRSCLNATLIIAYVVDDFYHVYMYGDGVVIVEENDGAIRIADVEYTKNAPYYLGYRLSQEDTVEYHNLNQDLTITTNDKTTKYAYDYETHWLFPCSEFKKLLIASDGIASFMENKIHPVSINDVTKEFLAYKSTKGEFLKRRLKRALKIYDKNGIEHFDDLSVGVFLNEE